MADHIPLPLEQNMQTPIAEAAAILGDRQHALAKADIVHPVFWYLIVMRQQPMALFVYAARHDPAGLKALRCCSCCAGKC